MSGKRTYSLLAVAVFLGLTFGCNSSGSDNDGDGGANPVGPSPGSYAGTWSGNVCGRGLTMNILQNGMALSGDYTFTNPDFGEAMSGTVTSETPPASAVLNAGGDRRFEITFDSYNSLSGGFFKGSDRVCEVNATKP
jgi:hypothetical protein